MTRVRFLAGTETSLSPRCADRLWCPPSLLFKVYRDVASPGAKAAGVWSWPHLRLVIMLRMRGIYLHCPYIFTVSYVITYMDNFKFARNVQINRFREVLYLLQLRSITNDTYYFSLERLWWFIIRWVGHITKEKSCAFKELSAIVILILIAWFEMGSSDFLTMT